MKFRIKLMVVVFVLVAGSITAHAKVDVTKDRDSHVKVCNTLFGFRIGDSVYDGDLPAGHGLVVTEGWWATDPSGTGILTNSDTIFQPTVHDSCFQFYCKFPESEWFYLDPGPCGKNVYWLSIAAIYDPTAGDPQFPWGWKTRPKYFNDDAIRIRSIVSRGIGGAWPPQVGSQYISGDPVEYPKRISWDLAFEFTTNRECPPAPNWADFGLSGRVDFGDFALWAEEFLATWP